MSLQVIAAEELVVDHFQVAAMLSRREKVIRTASVFETAWLKLICFKK